MVSGHNQLSCTIDYILYAIFYLEGLEILHQSGNIKVESFLDPVILYCIPSVHSSDVLYTWELVGKESVCFPCSPVVTVGRTGMYKCTVVHGMDSVASDLMWVSMKLKDDQSISDQG